MSTDDARRDNDPQPRPKIQIIGEDARHLIIAISIDKEWLAAQFDFLVALTDFAGLLHPDP
ncbi:hypothetical protein [Bradyrhizobium sp. STM 3557]|uniref:hypothetical protein n=1 Tax=Bradyrhizobium sp. STM 3557 TaxID=578920 RepID=UPI00388EA1C8